MKAVIPILFMVIWLFSARQFSAHLEFLGEIAYLSYLLFCVVGFIIGGFLLIDKFWVKK